MDATPIVRRLLTALSHTAATRELDKHMDLYSRELQVFGVPGKEILDHGDVALRRQTEFARGLLLRLVYEAPDVIDVAPQNITYRVQEIMRTPNRSALVLQKKVIIGQETDGKWRIQKEHILRAEMNQISLPV